MNTIRPENFVTPMAEGFLNEVPTTEQFLKSLQPITQSLGRFGKPEEIAHAVLFLCDENVELMTGTMLSVDGGWIAR